MFYFTCNESKIIQLSKSFFFPSHNYIIKTSNCKKNKVRFQIRIATYKLPIQTFFLRIVTLNPAIRSYFLASVSSYLNYISQVRIGSLYQTIDPSQRSPLPSPLVTVIHHVLTQWKNTLQSKEDT